MPENYPTTALKESALQAHYEEYAIPKMPVSDPMPSSGGSYANTNSFIPTSDPLSKVKTFSKRRAKGRQLDDAA